MSSVVIAGDTSGTVTLAAPAVAGTTTLTLPATSGTIVTTATSTGISGSAITTGTVGVSVGGTGANTLTANNVILGAGTSAVTFVAPSTTGNVLTSNGSTWTSAAAPGGGLGGTTVFTANGTFTIPTGKTVVKVTVVGGGNSGPAGNSCSFHAGSGGGAGGAAIKYLTGLTPGNTLTVTRGAAGGTSSVASGTQTITTISATGGSAGVLGGASHQGGAGGSGTNGDWNIQGSPGFTSISFEYASEGLPTLRVSRGGQGGSSILGFGGNPASSDSAYGPTSTAQAGQAYGAGGGGGAYSSLAGAAGAVGVVIFEY